MNRCNKPASLRRRHISGRANKKAENKRFPPCNVPVCVGETGFEPATSNSRSWRANRTALHPELKCGANIQLISISCSKNRVKCETIRFLPQKRRQTRAGFVANEVMLCCYCLFSTTVTFIACSPFAPLPISNSTF